MEALRQIARRLTIALFKIDQSQLAFERTNALNASEHCLMYALDDGASHSQRQIHEEWLIPKTTLNTIVKQWERRGLLTLSPLPGKRREMQILLTPAGRDYVRAAMGPVYRAEEKALAQTLARYSDTFIEALSYFGAALQQALADQA